MAKLILDISTSLDGFVAGPDPDLENPLGLGGMQLHEWVFGAKAWREAHGLEGGEEGIDSELTSELIGQATATVMGRKMYSNGSGPWEDDPKANGWWGDEPPFHHDVFVLTHHQREPLVLGDTTFHFVSDGIESALEQAKSAAGDGDVRLGGGADVAQQYLRAGLLDVAQLHVVPLLLGGGVRLFGDHDSGAVRELELTRVLESPTGVIHLSYRADDRSR
ncbi:MAG TPA: dihydrofolate reductase family protein [Thermoleophilaceae bacterium]|jgi:dihydrofolate reductase